MQSDRELVEDFAKCCKIKQNGEFTKFRKVTPIRCGKFRSPPPLLSNYPQGKADYIHLRLYPKSKKVFFNRRAINLLYYGQLPTSPKTQFRLKRVEAFAPRAGKIFLGIERGYWRLTIAKIESF
eukprot:GEMP01018276.1.p1 GENE.GEMP01018276.1~~GEMP01018276.1.p1  ORF type:complete len:124 (-),score=3.88 GEMP01018276.1:1183-1554(-)